MCTVTMYDYLRVPEHLQPGEYVLGFVSNPSTLPLEACNRADFAASDCRALRVLLQRWDCETSAQVWQSCADVKIKARAQH